MFNLSSLKFNNTSKVKKHKLVVGIFKKCSETLVLYLNGKIFVETLNLLLKKQFKIC